MFEVGTYHDQATGRTRWAVLETTTRAWYFPRRYGRAAAWAYCRRLNEGGKVKAPRLIVEYRGCNIYRNTSLSYALRWQATCNGLRLAADTLAGAKALIRETLESDKILGAM